MSFLDRIRRKVQPDPDYIAQHDGGTPVPYEDEAVAAALHAYRELMRQHYHFVRDADGDIVAWPKAKPNAPRGGTWAIWRYAQMDPDIIAYRPPRGLKIAVEDIAHD